MDLKIIALRLVLALLLGGLIGLERQFKHHPVGMRTNVLVCIASAMVMILSELLTQKSFMLYGAPVDPRLGGQVITGIGFLGAGTIMHANSTVKGLTTAASLWGVACIGLAVGAGYYELGILTCLLVFIVLSVLNYLTKKLTRNIVIKQVTIIAKPQIEIVLSIMEALKSAGIDMQEVETNLPCEDNEKQAQITFITDNFRQSTKVLKALQNIEGIIELNI